MTDNWRVRTSDDYELLEYILTWPNPFLPPINTERRFQFDGGYRGPRGGTLRMDGETADWVDLIHEHVGEESDD